jgi:hypothetical protein
MFTVAVCSGTPLFGHARLDRIDKRTIKIGPTGFNIPLESWLGLKGSRQPRSPQPFPSSYAERSKAPSPPPKKEKDILYN